MDKVSSFFVGNAVGITILFAGILITAPKKLKETEAIQKEASQQKAQAQRDNGAFQKTKVMTSVVIASRDIARGQKIRKEDLSIKEVSSDHTENYFLDIDAAVGKTANTDIPFGSTITAKFLN
jgi:flagella basal body P-ring formation protein FlgA